MAKNSRFLESLVHDIPMYPFSATPDGRIVAELHRGRRESKEFQERALAIQERAIERLADLHKGAMLVPAGDFRSSEAARILGDVAYEMQNVYTAQERSAQGIEALGQATTEGFGQVHDDLTDIKGPPYPHEHLDGLVENDGDFFAAMCAYSKGMLNRNATGEFHCLFEQKMRGLQQAVHSMETDLEVKIQEEQLRHLEQLQKRNQKGGEATLLPTLPLKTLNDFPELVEAFKLFKNPLRLLTEDRGKIYGHLAVLLQAGEQYDVRLLKNAVEHVDRFFESYRRAQQTLVPQEMLIQLGKNHLLVPAVQHQVLKHFPETRDDPSLATVNYSLLDIARDTRTAIQQQNVLTAIGAASLEGQKRAYEQRETLITKADKSLEQGQLMIAQGNEAQRLRKVAATEQKISNYHLASIVKNLTVVKDEMIDLGEIVEDFAEMVEEGLEQVNDTLQIGFGATVTVLGNIDGRLGRIDQCLEGMDGKLSHIDAQLELTNDSLIAIDQTLLDIQLEIVMTRTAVVAELRNIDETILNTGSAVIRSIERTNELLSELVELTRERQKNEARQHFEDGASCLATAENLEHIEAAYRRFCKGIEAHHTTVWNHYGAGLAAELLMKLSEARKSYQTTIAQSKSEQNELKSQAQEGLARVEYKSENLPEAIKQSRDAVKTNPENHNARYDLAKYLILAGMVQESITVLSKLIEGKHVWYLKMKCDRFFQQISKEYLIKLWKNLMSMNGTSLDLSLMILEDVLTVGQKQLAVNIIMTIVRLSPRKLIEKKIWLHPHFSEIREELLVNLSQYINDRITLFTAKTCYELSIVLSGCGVSEDTTTKVIQQGVDHDPDMYKKQKGKSTLTEKLRFIDRNETEKLEQVIEKIIFPNL